MSIDIRAIAVSNTLPCGIHAARDLQRLGQLLARADRPVEGGPRATHCSLASMAHDETSPASNALVVTMAESARRKESEKEERRQIEAVLDRVLTRREGRAHVGDLWYRLLWGAFVERRNVDNVDAVLFEVGERCATEMQLKTWTRAKRLSQASVRHWARSELEKACVAYDEERGR